MQTSTRFEIERIGVRGHSRLIPQSIVKQLQIQPHTNIFQIQLDTVHQQVESLQWVKKAQVYRNFPNKLSITLTERTPFALVKLDELCLVDLDGVILGVPSSASEITLPIISGMFVDDLKLKGENPRFGQALHAIQDLMHSSVPLFKNIRTIHIQSLENTRFQGNSPGPDVWVSLANYQKNLQHLQKIYPELPVDTLASIDLRFERRIIVNLNKS